MSFHQILEISAASPAWQMYTTQMDALVLGGLKSSILTSLDAMCDNMTNEAKDNNVSFKLKTYSFRMKIFPYI